MFCIGHTSSAPSYPLLEQASLHSVSSQCAKRPVHINIFNWYGVLVFPRVSVNELLRSSCIFAHNQFSPPPLPITPSLRLLQCSLPTTSSASSLRLNGPVHWIVSGDPQRDDRTQTNEQTNKPSSKDVGKPCHGGDFRRGPYFVIRGPQQQRLGDFCQFHPRRGNGSVQSAKE